MPRTPLFGMLRRTLALSRHSLTSPESTAELVERARWETPVSRRRFLGYAGAGAMGAALGGCLPPTTGRGGGAGEPVLVVGAGLAGLTAAYRLRQGGVNVRLIEAQNRVGGRIHTLRGFFGEGQVAELGGELIDSDHEHLMGLARELGLSFDDLHGPGSLAGDTWYFAGAHRSEAEIVAAFRPVAERIEQELGRLGDEEITYRTGDAARGLDRISLSEWLDRAGARGWFRDLLEVAYTAEFGLEPGEQSALNLLLMIDPEPDPFRVFGASDERFHLRGGNDRITDALARRVGDAIETGTVLEAIRLRSDGRFQLDLRRGEGAFTASAESVVLTLPFTLLREVRMDVPLPPAKLRAIAELGYGTNAKLMVGFSSRPWAELHGASGGSFADLPYQSSWDTSRAQPGRGGILTNFTGGAAGVAMGAGTPAERAAPLLRDLEHVYPGVSAHHLPGREARFHWPSFPWTRGSYACYRPGQWTTLRAAEGEPVGRLHFAGEHCSLDYQGFMEGACESGERAAAEILAARGGARAQTPGAMAIAR